MILESTELYYYVAVSLKEIRSGVIKQQAQPALATITQQQKTAYSVIHGKTNAASLLFSYLLNHLYKTIMRLKDG